MTQTTPTLGWIYGLDAVGVRSLCLYQTWIRYLQFSIPWKVIRGSQNFEIGSRDPGHAHLGWICGLDAVGVRSLCLCQIWIRYLHSFKSYKGVPKFRNLVTWPRQRPLWGRFMIRTQLGFVLYVCAKFESDISIPSKVIRGVPKFRNSVTWPRPRPLRGHFMVRTPEGASSMYVTNLNRISLFLQKLLGGSQN